MIMAKISFLRKLGFIAVFAVGLMLPGVVFAHDYSFPGGQCDNFDTTDGTELSSPSPAFFSWMTTNCFSTLTSFDAIPRDKCFGHTFTGLPGKICSAFLTIHLRAHPTDSLTNTDGLALQLTSPTGPFVWGISMNDLINVATGGSQPTWTPGSDHIFRLDLGNLPPDPNSVTSVIASMNTTGALDVYVQDDTGVDCITLDVNTDCPRPPCLSLPPCKKPGKKVSIKLDTGMGIPPGSPDPNWVLIIPSPHSVGSAYATTTLTPQWVIPPAGVSWLQPSSSGSPDSAALPGTYIYSLQFCLEELGNKYCCVRLRGKFSADNSGILKLNGGTIVQCLGPTCFKGWVPFNVTTGFVSGINTLEVEVQNDELWTGVVVEATLEARCCKCKKKGNLPTTADNDSSINGTR